MSTTSAPEPRPQLLDPETIQRLHREEGIIRSLTITSIAAGDAHLETYFNAIEMADALREYHHVVARRAKAVSSESGTRFHTARAEDAEQLRLWFVNLLDQAITQKPNTTPAIASIRFEISNTLHGGIASEWHKPTSSNLENLATLQAAFLTAMRRSA